MSLTDFFTSSDSGQSTFQQLLGDVAAGYNVYDSISSGAPPAAVTRAAGSGSSATSAAKPAATIFGIAWYWAVIAVIVLALLGFGIYKLAG